MTSTTTFGGFNPEKRNSSKVLKPPGGGSSDIFGATGSQEAGTPRRVKNHQQSNLFLNDDVASNTPSRNHGKDTYSRLFGPAQETPSSSVKNRMKSNILLSDEDAANRNMEPPKDEAKSAFSESVDGQMNGGGENGHVEEMQQPQQQAMMNGNGGAMNGNPAPQAPAQPRTRVPPGGFSSGLW